MRIALLLAGLLASPHLLAQAGAPEQADELEAVEDETFISMSGTVESTRANSFVMEIETGQVIVEMDGLPGEANAAPLQEGDEVTVFGEVDKGFQDAEGIDVEAESVYVERLNTYLYSNWVENEDRGFVAVSPQRDPSTVVVQGRVRSVSNTGFTLNTGSRRINVSTEALSYNPLDDEGYQKVEEGDEVSVTGQISGDYEQGRRLVAEVVTSIEP